MIKKQRRETVTRVIDGDTFMTKSRSKPVRIANYNAPEKGLKGSKSRQNALDKLISNKKVTVKTKARDVYGRVVADVFVDGKSLSRILKNKFKK